MTVLGRLVTAPMVALIVGYQRFVSPMRPPTCRYYPSCSAYAVTALQRFGPVKGTWLAVKRLVRCHPWTPGGVDHVPPREPATSTPTAA
jgi:putative membrane protein insertion efficiency factor